MKISPEKLRLYAISDRRWLTNGNTLEQVTELLLQNGATCLQLREKNLPESAFYQEALALQALCRRYHVPFLINDRVAIAKAVQADGVHVGLSDMKIRQAREILGPDAIIGGSAHNVAEALAAEAAGADYLGCGAVFGSSTKQDAFLLPLYELKAICKAVKIPVVAIGGITESNLFSLAGSGIAGAAAIGALYAAADPSLAAKRLRALAERLISETESKEGREQEECVLQENGSGTGKEESLCALH